MFTVIDCNGEGSFDTLTHALRLAFAYAGMGRSVRVAGPRGWIWITDSHGVNGRFVGDYAK